MLAAVAAGTTVATLDVDSIQENRTTFNVIAETKGGDHDNVLVLGGHTVRSLDAWTRLFLVHALPFPSPSR